MRSARLITNLPRSDGRSIAETRPGGGGETYPVK